MRRSEWPGLAARGLAAWAALSALGWLFAVPLAQALLPLLECGARWMAPEFAPALRVVADGPECLIELSAWALRPILVAADWEIAPGQTLTARTHVTHTLVPAVIELAVLSAWPARRWTRRLVLLLAGLATAPLVAAAVTPALLLGLIEIQLQEAAARAGGARPVPWVLDWMLFCEMGGRWLLPLAAAWSCIRLPSRWAEKPASDGKTP